MLEDLKSHLGAYYDDIITILPKIAVGIVVVLIIWLIAKSFKSRLVAFLNKKSDDPLLANFIGRLYTVVVVVIMLALFLKIIDLGNIAAGIAGTAGVGAFIIGFAFKDLGEHFLAGFILAFNRPFHVGDLVELDGEKGKVISLNIRDTQLKTSDGRDLFIPNGNVIKNTLVNYTIDGFMRQEVTIGVDYDSDINKAIKIILGEMSQISGILNERKAPSVSISNLGSSSIDLTVYYWLDTFDQSVSGSKVKIEIINRLLTALEGAEINMPGTIVELKNYTKEKVQIQMNANA